MLSRPCAALFRWLSVRRSAFLRHPWQSGSGSADQSECGGNQGAGGRVATRREANQPSPSFPAFFGPSRSRSRQPCRCTHAAFQRLVSRPHGGTAVQESAAGRRDREDMDQCSPRNAARIIRRRCLRPTTALLAAIGESSLSVRRRPERARDDEFADRLRARGFPAIDRPKAPDAIENRAAISAGVTA